MREQDEMTIQQIQTLEQELRKIKQQLVPKTATVEGLTFPLDVLLATVASFTVALRVSQVDGLVRMAYVSPLPRAPDIIRGTINCRGRLAPVVDIRCLFSGEVSPLTPEMLLALVSTEKHYFALVVDRIENVRKFERHEVEEAPAIALLPGFVSCLVRDDQRAIAVLDPESFLASAELDALDEVLPKTALPATGSTPA